MENNYVPPTIVIPATETSETRVDPKPRSSYTNLEKAAFTNNFKALNAIFQALEDDETNRISSCLTAHDAWEAL